MSEKSVNRLDRGSISVMVAATAVSLVVMVGLVLDCGGRLRAIEQADALAQEAARAGGQQLDIDALRAGRGYRLDRNAAQSTAVAYLTSRQIPAGAISFPRSSDSNSFDVAITIDYPTALLSVVGVANLPVHGQGRATVVHGITEGTIG